MRAEQKHTGMAVKHERQQLQDSRLLALPAELRIHIYELVFTTGAGGMSPVDILHASGPSKALLLTSRQIYDEAGGIFKEAHRRYWTGGHFVLDRRNHMPTRAEVEALKDDDVNRIAKRHLRLFDADEGWTGRGYPLGLDSPTLQVRCVDYRGGWLVQVLSEEIEPPGCHYMGWFALKRSDAADAVARVEKISAGSWQGMTGEAPFVGLEAASIKDQLLFFVEKARWVLL